MPDKKSLVKIISASFAAGVLALAVCLQVFSYTGTWSSCGGTWAFGTQDHYWIRIVTDSGADSGAPYANIITSNLSESRANGGLGAWYWRLWNTYGGTSTNVIWIDYVKIEDGRFNDTAVSNTQINNWFQPADGVKCNPNTVTTQNIFNGFNVSATGKYTFRYFPVHTHKEATESSCRTAYGRYTNVYFYNPAEINALRDLANVSRNQAVYTPASWAVYAAARSAALTITDYFAGNNDINSNYSVFQTHIFNFAAAKNNLDSAIAQLKPATYTVTYDGNGASGGSTQESVHTVSISSPLTLNGFTRTGYSFAGWAVSPSTAAVYSNGQNVLNLASEGSVTLYAKWNPISYSIQYWGNGNTGGTMGDTAHTYDIPKTLAPNAFIKTGYTFAGWSLTQGGALAYTDGMPVVNLAASSGAVINLYARWQPITYNIIYNASVPDGYGGMTAPSSHTFDVSSPLSINGYFRPGYSFIGWATSLGGAMQYIDGDSVTNLTDSAGGLVNLYAVWSENQYVVVYHANGGTGATPNSVHVYGKAKALTANGFSKTGYTFAGWAATADGPVAYANSQSVVNLAVSGSVPLFAKWTPNTYSVIYIGNTNTGGSTPMSVHTYNLPQNLSANGFTKTGSVFLGWAAVPSAAVPVYVDSQQVTNLSAANNDVIILYAVWGTQPQLIAKTGSTTIIDNNGGFIYGLEPGTTQSGFENNFVSVAGNARLIYTPAGSRLGTGTKVDLVDNSAGAVLQTYYIVIFGDVSGDGSVDSMDAGMIVDYENYMIPWNAAADAARLKAADINGDMTVDSIDAGILVDYENYLIGINQTDGLYYDL